MTPSFGLGALHRLCRLGITRHSLLFSLVLLSGAVPGWAQSFNVDSTIDAVDASPGDGECATAAGECTLRAAIQEASILVGVQLIILPAGVYGLTEGELEIAGDLSLSGDPGLSIIDGNFRSRVLTIGSSGDVTMSGVTIQRGSATGIGNAAGILVAGGTLALSDSSIRNNDADCGEAGGILNSGGTLALTRTTIADNFSCGTAGILNAGGTLVLTDSTISGNATLFDVAGIANRAGLTRLTNSTVSSNRCVVFSPAYDYVGGILNEDGVLTLNNATVTENLCVYGVGGLLNVGAGTLTVGNTIVAQDCQGVVVSAGYNLDSDRSCGLSGPGDLSGVDPRLGALQDNGGPTFTHTLLVGSPAIDAGNPTPPGGGDGACDLADQRGVARPQGPTCDMGAYEREISEGNPPRFRSPVPHSQSSKAGTE